MKKALRAFLRQVLNEAPAPLGMTKEEYFAQLAAEGAVSLGTADGTVKMTVKTKPAPAVPVELFTLAQFEAASEWFNNNQGAFKFASACLLNEDDDSFKALVDLTAAAIEKDGSGYPLHQFALASGIIPPSGGARVANIAWQTFASMVGMYWAGGALGALGKGPGAISTGNKLLLFSTPVIQAIVSAFDMTLGARPEEDFNFGGSLPTSPPVDVSSSPTVPARFRQRQQENLARNHRRKNLSLAQILNEAVPADIADTAIDKALKELIGSEIEGFTGSLASRIMGDILNKAGRFETKEIRTLLDKITEVVTRYEDAGGPRIITDDELKAFIKAHANEIFTPETIQALTGNFENQLIRSSLVKALEDMGVSITKGIDEKTGKTVVNISDDVIDVNKISPDTLLGMSIADIRGVQTAIDAPFAPLDVTIITKRIAEEYAIVLEKPESITAASVSSRLKEGLEAVWVDPYIVLEPLARDELGVVGGDAAIRARLGRINEIYSGSLRASGLEGRNLANTPFPLIDTSGRIRYATIYADPVTLDIDVDANGFIRVIDVRNPDLVLTIDVDLIGQSLEKLGTQIVDKALFTNNTFFKLVEDRARSVTAAVNASNAEKTAAQFADDLNTAIDQVAQKKSGTSFMETIRGVKEAAGVPQGFFPILTARSVRAFQEAAAKAGMQTAEDAAKTIGSFAFSKRGAKALGALLLLTLDETAANLYYCNEIEEDIVYQYNAYGATVETVDGLERAAKDARDIAEAIRQVYATPTGFGTQSPAQVMKFANVLAGNWLTISKNLSSKVAAVRQSSAGTVQESRILRALIREALRS